MSLRKFHCGRCRRDVYVGDDHQPPVMCSRGHVIQERFEFKILPPIREPLVSKCPYGCGADLFESLVDRRWECPVHGVVLTYAERALREQG